MCHPVVEFSTQTIRKQYVRVLVSVSLCVSQRSLALSSDAGMPGLFSRRLIKKQGSVLMCWRAAGLRMEGKGEGKTGGKEGMEKTLNEAVITLLRAQQDTTLQTLPYVHTNTCKLKDKHTHEKGNKNISIHTHK